MSCKYVAVTEEISFLAKLYYSPREMAMAFRRKYVMTREGDDHHRPEPRIARREAISYLSSWEAS